MENAARMSESPSTEEMESLRDLVPLHTLPDDALADLSEHVVFETIKKGQILFNEGDTDHENVYLVKGKVVLLSGRSVVERIVAGTDTARTAAQVFRACRFQGPHHPYRQSPAQRYPGPLADRRLPGCRF